MKTRKLLMGSAMLNAALLASIVFLSTPAPQREAVIKPAVKQRVVVSEQEPASNGYGPVFETVLQGAGSDGRPVMYDLERGRQMVEPQFEVFSRDARANASWILSSGLDLSGFVSPARLGFISYSMALVPCSPDAWTTMPSSELLESDDLRSVTNTKRRLLFCAEQPTCYLFRTYEGATGLLLVPPASNAGDTVKIRYKFAQPAQRQFAAAELSGKHPQP